jgi:pyruvate,water dikinase
VKFEKTETVIDLLPKPPVPVQVIMSDPDTALRTSLLPVSGVGLARLEFIITHAVGVHPMALVHPATITDAAVRKKIDAITAAFSSGAAFFVDTVGRAVALIAAAFYPRPVLVRLSDFKTNEYRNLLGGEFFETEEENPMLGFRGASRYIDPRYADAFALECAALKWARETAGFDTIRIMVPFVRTLAEAESVIEALKKHGLERGKDGLELYMMCEIPSNVALIEQFAAYFDGFSIGSNDLTQLTLGVDRDSGVLGIRANETDPAVMQMMALAIAGAHKAGKPIGICGQAPSDYPEIAEFLVAHKIDSISLNPDSVIPYLVRQK